MAHKFANLPAAALAALLLFPNAARTAEPITIGFGMGLTGGLASAGKSALLAMQIWRDDVNAKGGLLGRPVKLIYYDDQSNPATVPGIYTKLLEVDKADLIVSGYGTNLIAPAMPVAIQHDRLFLGLFGLSQAARMSSQRAAWCAASAWIRACKPRNGRLCEGSTNVSGGTTSNSFVSDAR